MASSLALIFAFSVIPLVSASPFRPHIRRNTTMATSWTSITASANLTWTPCFETFSCALLTVPLDYSNPSIGTTNIAYVKFSATNSIHSQDILINPGGPGGSGVDTVLANGLSLSNYLGSQYNIIGFDPRGVGNSGPNVDCFPGAPAAGLRLQETFGRPINSQDPNSLSEQFAKGGAYGDWCSRVYQDGDAKYANTHAVAEDMMNYVEKAAVLAGKAAEEAKLWYYGVSYGTALGATFAYLFPDRVGRLILDGVVDTEMYFGGSWDQNLDHADEVVESFFKFCFAAGPEKCVFWANSTDEISNRLDAVIADVRANPVEVSDPNFVAFPTIVTYETLVFALLSALYAPPDTFPMLAQVLLELESRSANLLAATFPPQALSVGSAATIICLDSVSRYNLSTEQKWEEHVHRQVNQSAYVGDAWASTALPCRKMHIAPPTSQQLDGAFSVTSTNTPILFIGNTYDPVTPIKMARKMSGLFGGSVVLEQNSVGHCSIAALSSCTMGYIQGYLKEGRLPEDGTVCEPNGVPFGNATTVHM